MNFKRLRNDLYDVTMNSYSSNFNNFENLLQDMEKGKKTIAHYGNMLRLNFFLTKYDFSNYFKGDATQLQKFLKT